MVVGLGNPGKRYRRTRHNVGFMVVDLAGRDLGDKWETVKSWRAEVMRAEGGMLLAKPLTFMNESGVAISRIARHFRIRPEELLVVYDDVALPFGQLRVRPGGSAGGHNGISDIIRVFGTQEFARLKVGIAPEEGVRGDLADFVLADFTSNERSGLDKVLGRATHAVVHVLEYGVESAMNAFNGRIKESASPDQQDI